MEEYFEKVVGIAEDISNVIGATKYRKKVGQRLEKIFKYENSTGKKIKYSYFYNKYMQNQGSATASRYFDHWLKGERDILQCTEVLKALHEDEQLNAHLGYLLGLDVFLCDSLEEYKHVIEHDLPTYYLDKDYNTVEVLPSEPYIDYIRITNEFHKQIKINEELESLVKDYFPIFKDSGLGLMMSGNNKDFGVSMIQVKTGKSKRFNKDSFEEFLNKKNEYMNKLFEEYEE